ncbi:MAG: hypothetical protein LVS60_10805 [Nodosilinea sp. LVE1205-7]
MISPVPAPAAVTANPPLAPALPSSPELITDPTLANPDPAVTDKATPPPKVWPRLPRLMAGATETKPPVAPANPVTPAPPPSPVPIAPAPSSQSTSPAVNL